MVRKAIWICVVAPAGILLVAFAVANRHAVRLVLDPFAPNNPVLALEAPLFLWLFGALGLGLLLGGGATWLAQGRWRKAARRRGQEVTELKRETERLNRETDEALRPRLTQAARAD